MAAEGGATGELGEMSMLGWRDRAPFVLGAASPRIDTEDLSCFGAGLMKFGEGSVIGGIGIAGIAAGAFALGVLGVTGVVCCTFACGAFLRARVVPGTVPEGVLVLGEGSSGVLGTVTDGILLLGEGRVELTDGSGGNVSSEDSGGVGSPGTGDG